VKLLHISNHYPPYSTGPVERQCRLIVNELAHRGHFNRVLTSHLRTPGVPDRERFALRKLYLAPATHPPFTRLLRNERHNLAALRSALDELPADAVIVWSMTGLSNSLLWELYRQRRQVVYIVFDSWPRNRLKNDPWFAWWTAALPFRERLIRRLLRTTLLARPLLERFPVQPPNSIPLRDACFASRALRESIRSAGYAIDGSEIIPYCIGRDEIPATPHRRDEIRRLLWVGSLDMENDPMTAIQAIQELRHGGSMQFSLDIFGRGDVAFESRLHDYVRAAQLAGVVTIRHARVEDMTSLYPTYDAFLFTARTPEAFPVVLLRAMSARLPIVTTVEGSCADLIRNGENALVFRTGDPVDCAEKILELVAHPERIDPMTERAYRQVLDNHAATIVAGRIERLVQRVLDRLRQAS